MLNTPPENPTPLQGSGSIQAKDYLIQSYKNKTLLRSSALYQIGQALAGDLTVCNIEMTRLQKYIHGFMNDRIYLLGADSGVGKTTLGDWMLFNTIEFCRKKGVPIKVLYYSWEIARSMKEAKWLAMIIYRKWGVRLSSEYLLGRMPKYMPDENHLRMVLWAYKELEEIMKYIEFIEYTGSAAEVDDQVLSMASEYGTIQYLSEARDNHKIRSYEKKDPRSMLIVMYDHIALVDTEYGEKTKDGIDAIAKNAVKHRNIFQISSIILQQFSTDLMSMSRNKHKGPEALIPQRIDFGDSKYTYRDADVVMGAVRPADFDVVEYCGFDITELGRFFVALHLMKNRYGDAGIYCPLFMDYIPGIPLDLPGSPMEMLAGNLDDFLTIKTKTENAYEHYCAA